MAVLTLLWRVAKVHVLQRKLHVRGPVTVGTAYGPVSAGQQELGCCVIERGQIGPFFRRVAHFAPASARRHALGKLAAMGIGMTGCAGQVCEMIGGGFARSWALVALSTWNRLVPPGELEVQLLVLGEGEQRRLKALHGVARLALRVVRRMHKLPFVIILVAVHAFAEPDLVNRRRTRRNVALRAIDSCMLSEQWIRGLVVIREGEVCLFEAVHGVAGFALTTIRPFRELAVVRVLMTIAA